MVHTIIVSCKDHGEYTSKCTQGFYISVTHRYKLTEIKFITAGKQHIAFNFSN